MLSRPFRISLILLCSLFSVSLPVHATASNVLLPSRDGSSTPITPNIITQHSIPSAAAPLSAQENALKEISRGTYVLTLPDPPSLPSSGKGLNRATVTYTQNLMVWTGTMRQNILRYVSIAPHDIEPTCRLEMTITSMGKGGASILKVQKNPDILGYSGSTNMVFANLYALCPTSTNLNKNLGVIRQQGDAYVIPLAQNICAPPQQSPTKIIISKAGETVICQME